MLKVVEVIGSISSVLLLYMHIRNFFSNKPNASKFLQVIVVSSIIIFLSLLNLYPTFVIPRVFCLIFGGTLVCRIFFEATIWQALFMGISFEVIAATVEVGIMGVLGIFHFDAALLMASSNARMIYIIASQLLLLLIIVSVGTFSVKPEGVIKIKLLIPLFPCQLLSIFVCYIVLRNAVQDSFDSYLILVLLTLLYINIAIVFYVEAIRTSESRRRQHELAEQQYSMQKEYYQRLHENQEETRALWHDIKKYVLAMQALADQKEGAQLRKIVQQAKETLTGIGTVVDVDNIVISSILDNYAHVASEADINFHLDVMVPPVLSVSPVDLYIILGNTLDNAIEACNTLPKERRQINLLLRKENGILFYRIQNECDGNEKVHLHGRFHGYGLANVQKCVSRYNGSVNITKTHDAFTIEIYINCTR